MRVAELLIRQHTQVINALRGHLTEFGQIVPQGASNATRLIAIVEDQESDLPTEASTSLRSQRRKPPQIARTSERKRAMSSLAHQS